jgi:beta-lactamase regulating signal transducer with metallopeptidase domain
MVMMSANTKIMAPTMVMFTVAAAAASALPTPEEQPNAGHHRLDARDDPLIPTHEILAWVIGGISMILFLLLLLWICGLFVLCMRDQVMDRRRQARQARAELVRQMEVAQHVEGHTEGHTENHAETTRPANARLAKAWRCVRPARYGAPDKPEGVNDVELGDLEVRRTVTNQYGVPDKPM